MMTIDRDHEWESVADYVDAVDEAVSTLMPELEYTSAELYGFCSAAWPTDSDPVEMAQDFVNAINPEEMP